MEKEHLGANRKQTRGERGPEAQVEGQGNARTTRREGIVEKQILVEYRVVRQTVRKSKWRILCRVP